MARYRHEGSVHMFKKKSAVGEVLGALVVGIVILMIIGALAG